MHELKCTWIVQWCFSFDDINSFQWLDWAIIWSALWMCLYILATWFSKIDLWALSMQTNFPSYVRASSSSFLLQRLLKYFIDYFWKPIIPFSTFFLLMLIVFWCSNPFTAVFFRKKILESFIAPARWGSCACSKRVSGRGRLEETWTPRDAYKSWTWCSNAVQT